MASLWQQAGRAGRREQASTSIYIAFDGPLDQYYFQHPQQLFGRAIEHSQVCDWAPDLQIKHKDANRSVIGVASCNVCSQYVRHQLALPN